MHLLLDNYSVYFYVSLIEYFDSLVCVFGAFVLLIA